MDFKVLNPIKKLDRKYKKVLGFDIETKGETNEFVLACFWGKDLKIECTSKQEVLDFLNSGLIRNYIIFATNLAFDFLGCLYDKSDNWSVSERGGVIYSFKWYQNKSEDGVLKNPINFFDTMRILPFSVEKLGKLLKIPKMDHPSCFAKQPKTPKDWEELGNYCMNDAKISCLFITEIVYPFLEKYNLGLKSTIGSISLADFRTNYLNEPFFQETEDKRDFAFNSYYGGRTETFQRGLFKNVYCFDINSLYPSVMLEDMPDPNRSYINEKGTLKNINRFEGVSEVIVSVPKSLKIPPLPYKKDHKLIFPTGTFKGYYNHNELRNAMKYGVTILEVSKQLIFPRKKPYFRRFIEHHYKERLRLKALNSPLEVMEKNVMNNLYGKFAFNYKKTSSMIPVHTFDYEKHIEKASFIKSEGKFITIEESNPRPPVYSFPIWSSYITSYARIKMYEYLANPDIQHKILSTDTDSIFIKDYSNEIPTSLELGAMKLEDGYPVKSGYFIRPKFYFTHKPKCKGVKFANSVEFFEILAGKKVKQERFTKFRTAVRSTAYGKYGELKPNQILQIEKGLNLNDTKRLWSSVFNPFDEEYSNPLVLNWEQEELEAETKQTMNNPEMWLTKNNFIKGIVEGDQDLVDFTAKGKDISKEEYLENEIAIELID